jgi:thymidine kinase
MFIEPHIKAEKKGWVEVICGSMFSGKTEELIRRLKRAKIANKTIKIFKPGADTRYYEMNITSHDKNSIASIPILHSKEIIAHAKQAEVIGIDEAQFFDNDLPVVCEELALGGTRMIIAGLDMDFKGKPFGPMPYLLSIAEYITKLHAICVVCGNIASHSYRKVESQDQIVIGEMNIYEPRCRACFEDGKENAVSVKKKKRKKQ